MLPAHKNPIVVSYDRDTGCYIVTTFWNTITHLRSAEALTHLIERLASLDDPHGFDTTAASFVAVHNAASSQRYTGAQRAAEEALIAEYIEKHGVKVLANHGRGDFGWDHDSNSFKPKATKTKLTLTASDVEALLDDL